MKIKEIYPYMYYRLATWYLKYEPEKHVSSGASALVSLSQLLIITDILATFFLFGFSSQERHIVMDDFEPYYFIFVFAYIFYNNYKFKDKYEVYKKKWEHQSSNEKILYGFIIFLLLFIPLSYVFILVSIFDFNK